MQDTIWSEHIWRYVKNRTKFCLLRSSRKSRKYLTLCQNFHILFPENKNILRFIRKIFHSRGIRLVIGQSSYVNNRTKFYLLWSSCKSHKYLMLCQNFDISFWQNVTISYVLNVKF